MEGQGHQRGENGASLSVTAVPRLWIDSGHSYHRCGRITVVVWLIFFICDGGRGGWLFRDSVCDPCAMFEHRRSTPAYCVFAFRVGEEEGSEEAEARREPGLGVNCNKFH